MARRDRLPVGRALGATLLVAGGVLLGVYLTDRFGGPVWQVSADCAGPISHVVCVASSARRSTLRNAGLITSLVNALPAETRVTVLTNDRSAFLVSRPAAPGRVEFLDLPAESAFTIWPQDPMLVLEDGCGNRMLLASAEFERADDRLIPERLAAHLKWPCRTSSMAFEGGNIVVGPRHVFVGADTVRYNALRLGVSEVEVALRFERDLGRSVMVVGPAPQPISHIDMMLTPLDESCVVLADARWGADTAGRQMRESPEAVRAFERACEDLYFGDPRVREISDSTGRTLRPPSVVGRTADAVVETRAVADDLDRLADELATRKYRVLRVPILLRRSVARGRREARAGEDGEAAGFPSAARATPDALGDYPFLTYNNVLLEKRDGRCFVYLPRYGWPAMDEAAERAWKAAGAEVVGVAGLATSAMYGGSLRCCVKVLERKPLADTVSRGGR